MWVMGNFYQGYFMGSGMGIDNMAGEESNSFVRLSTWPQTQYNFTQNVVKYHILFPLLSILIITLGYLSQGKKVIIFRNTKFHKILLKKRRSFKNKRTLLIIPKMILVLLIMSEDLVDKRERDIDKIGRKIYELYFYLESYKKWLLDTTVPTICSFKIKI